MSGVDEFDDLDDYLDDFEEEILSQEPGATIIPETINEIDDISKITQSIGMNENLSNEISEFIKQLDPNGDGNELNDVLNSKEGMNENMGFQDTINETINRLKSSSKQVEDESSEKFTKDEELLTTLLNSLDIGGDIGSMEGMDELKGLLNGTNGGINDENNIDEMSNVLMNMLNKLTSKEMMYETISNAVNNYEEYFKKDNKEVKGDDMNRFKSQLKHLKNVKETFDKEDYNENDSNIREFIDIEMENFNKLLPPPEGVIEDNLSGLGLENFKWNEQDIPNELEGCVQQ